MGIKQCFWLLSFLPLINALLDKRPNVVIILADDMGFDDVSFRGSNEFLTPNIDALAFSGVILKNFYAGTMCTPSRAALLTGKHPIHTGMQHYVIPNYEPWGLPTNETTIADIFRQNGFFTSLLGKWHMGMSRRAYTPTFRGFDSFFGYLGAYIDYYDQTLYEKSKPYARGHDFRMNTNISHEHIGSYVTDVLTNMAIKQINEHNYLDKPLFMILSHLAPHSGNEDAPLQAPKEEIEKFKFIENVERRTYAAMMSILDKSVASVVDALYQKSVLNNTILLFMSDNGGPTVGLHSTTASNYPLRGQKNSPWEGGIRSSAAIWTSELPNAGSVWTQKLYIADLLPTLASAVGIKLNETTQLTDIDGKDMWKDLLAGNVYDRQIVHNIDDIFNYVSYMNGKWKFINGTTSQGQYDNWLGRRPFDPDATDPRARNYENVIKSTTVWKQLNRRNVKVNITKLRMEAEVKCTTRANDNGDEEPVSERKCEPLKAPCLFDIDADPCEMNNLYEENDARRQRTEILQRIAEIRKTVKKPINKPDDKRCDPALYNYEWTWWEDEVEDESSRASYTSAAATWTTMLLMTCVLLLTAHSVSSAAKNAKSELTK